MIFIKYINFPDFHTFGVIQLQNIIGLMGLTLQGRRLRAFMICTHSFQSLLTHQANLAVAVPKFEESERGQWVLTLYTRHDMIMFARQNIMLHMNCICPSLIGSSPSYDKLPILPKDCQPNIYCTVGLVEFGKPNK
jgi:hypothetical protein